MPHRCRLAALVPLLLLVTVVPLAACDDESGGTTVTGVGAHSGAGGTAGSGGTSTGTHVGGGGAGGAQSCESPVPVAGMTHDGEYDHVSGFPVIVSFDDDSYFTQYSVPWAVETASHTFLPNGGWDGCGAARMVPPSGGEGMSGMGQFLDIRSVTDTSFLAIRYCISAGATFSEHSHGAKPIILFRTDPTGSSTVHDFGSRPMVISRPDPNDRGIVYGLCDGTVCTYVGGDYWPDGSDTYWLAGDGAWACLEFDFDLANDEMRMYVSTQDGSFDDTLYLTAAFRDVPNSGPGGVFTGIDTVGGYFNQSTAEPDNYYVIDDLVIDLSHIGPPGGFVNP